MTALLLSVGDTPPTAYYLWPPDEEASTFGVEDRNGRLAYERLLTADPVTGSIPEKIRQKELIFARSLDARLSSAREQSMDFESAGPFNVGGRTRAVALDVRDENTILAGGVSGGMWKSMDGGHTWERKSRPGNRSSVTCLVQDTRPGKEDTWYYGTGELTGNSASGFGAPFRGSGIYKSTDNGETWTVIPSTVDSEPSIFNSQFQYIWDIVINDRHTDRDELIVAAFGGILRSPDGGDTWQVAIGSRLFDLPGSVNLNEMDASFFTSLEKTTDGIFYAALSTFSGRDGNGNDKHDAPNSGIYVSQDASEWYEITPLTSESTYSRIEIGHAPSEPSRCYFLIDTNPIFILRLNLSRFTTTGPEVAWSEPLATPDFGGDRGQIDTQRSYNMVVKVDPRNPSTVFIGGTNLYRSKDGFATKAGIDWIGGYEPSGDVEIYLNHHPDQHQIVFFPSDPSKMLSANDGGLRLTQNFNANSVTWLNRNNGYITSQFYTIALSQEAGDDIMLGGTQDNGTYLSGGGTNWNKILGGDGGYTAVTRGKTLWYASFQNGRTLRLTLNKAFELTSFARIDPESMVKQAGSDYLFINPFVLDPVNSNRMFVAGGNRLYANDNVSQIPGGSNKGTSQGWTKVEGAQIEEGVFSSIDISSDGSTVYAGSSAGRLFKITGANIPISRAAHEITNRLFSRGAISSISVNPEDENHLMVVFSNYGVPSIFESKDGGMTFQDISGALEENSDGSGNGPSVRCGELIPLNTGMLYVVGTSTGLYATETTGNNTLWVKQSLDQVGSAVIPMMDYRPIDGKLAVATHGNGVFTTSIPNFKLINPLSSGADFDLITAYPNPFIRETIIQYVIPKDGTVKIDIYSPQGTLINNLLWAPQFAGVNSITWNGANSSGTELANGIYLYRVEYDGAVKTGRLSLRK